MEEQRPNPDQLLKEVQEEEKRASQGKLKLFFGAAPGVGKTYAMLEAAQQKKAEGADVVIGLVETHGRMETEALLMGLEVLPRREMEYKGTILKELDLDGALRRKPEILLVDELAHTNSPGSRHKKRWQDVFELLEAGISVYSTLNVQHIESLNDVVNQITGVSVRETLPDSVVDRADEIELVDLPPDELLQRLREGKVYMEELAIRAEDNFFRRGNLLALREMALRRTAEQVDEQMRRYRKGKGVKAVWPAADRIMVCIGPNPFAIRLIRSAKRMADGLHAEWMAVNVEPPSRVAPSQRTLRQLDENMRLAESLGAETVTLKGHKVSEEILSYARVRNVTKIIIGKPTHPKWRDKIFGSLLDEVVRGSGDDLDVYVITGDTREPLTPLPAKVASQGPLMKDWRDWFLSFSVIAICTGISALLLPYLTLVDFAMIYILGIVLVSMLTSRGPSLMATILGVAAFDFFFVPPIYTFAVSDVRYFFTFGVMFFVAVVISSLTLRVKEQMSVARLRERRTSSLYSLSRQLVHERGIVPLSAIAVKHIGDLFSCRVVLLVPDEHGRLAPSTTGPETFALDQHELSVAQWVFDHGQKAGFGTDTLQGAKALYLPLITSSRTVGVLGTLPEASLGRFGHDQIQALESFSNQIALAVDRALLAEEAQRALLRAETETLRNTLLSSISHDLRTPLSAIMGASTALLRQDMTLEQQGRHELIRTIQEEADHLNQIIRNVLDMTRLEAKGISVKKEWHSAEEIVGVALNRLSEKLKEREVRVAIPEDLSLVPFDPLLIEQVLVNLLDNAIKYTPRDTPIELSARTEDRNLVVEVADRGPGIPPGEEERIFEKFVHGARGGIGLGLAICRVIIDAHGGRIEAENRAGGGAVFRFILPIEGKPPLPEPERENHGE